MKLSPPRHQYNMTMKEFCIAYTLARASAKPENMDVQLVMADAIAAWKILMKEQSCVQQD